MKRILLSMCMMSFIYCAQSQTYQLNGKLGIGMEPVEKLDVQGNMRVTGLSTIQGDADVDGVLTLNSDLRVPGLVNSENTTTLLSFDSEGKVDPISLQDLMDLIYDQDCREEIGEVFTPIWRASQGKLTVDGGNCYYDPLVGVGTTTPEYLFDVNGDSRISERLWLGTSSPISLFKFADNLHVSSGLVLHGPLSFEIPSDNPSFPVLNMTNTDGQPLYTLNGDGTLTLQTQTNSTSPLTVFDLPSSERVFEIQSDGTVLCTTLKVRSIGNFPDYVFDPNRQLMSLFELEKYINKNKRLPGMPSAVEVAENGADLGELNRLLVEKVEELTLYILELNKRIGKLEKKQ